MKPLNMNKLPSNILRRGSLVFGFVCLLLTSCYLHKTELAAAGDGIVLHVDYHYKESPGEAPASKNGQQRTAEALVKNVTFLLYNSAGDLLTATYTDQPNQPIALNIRNKTRASLYVVANVGDWTQKLNIVSIERLRQTYWPYHPDSLTADAALPMATHLESQVFEDGGKLHLSLERLVAKFRIQVDTSALSQEVEQFDIQEIRLRNLNRRVHFFDESKALYRSWIVDSSRTFSGSELSAIWEQGLDMYLPENCQGDLLTGNTDPSTHVPPSPYDTLCSYVEFVVNYRSKTQSDNHLIYRYYLHDGQLLDNFDVRRNTMYTCRTRFCGDGLNENSWRIDASGMQDLVTQIQLSPTTAILSRIGETIRLQASILPASAANPVLHWYSSNPEIASVNSEGVVTAQGQGTCTITASATDGSGQTATATISVNTYVAATSVVIYPRIGNTVLGNTFTFTATVLPMDATDRTAHWTTSNPKIATVNGDGVVTPKTNGRCKIIASTSNGRYRDTVDFEVSTKAFLMDQVPTLYPNYNLPWEITHTALPEGTPTYQLSDKTGLTSALTLNGNELLFELPSTWIGNPNSQILATATLTGSLNGIERSQPIQVSLGQIAFNSTYKLCQGVRERIVPDILIPEDIPVSWRSYDTKLLTFDLQGYALPLQPGTTRVSATTASHAQATFNAEIVAPSLFIMGGKQQHVYENQELQLECMSSPVKSSALKILWQIKEGQEYAQISPDGLLTGILRSQEDLVTVRAYFETLPHIYSEIQISVRPVVSATQPDSLFLNTTIRTPNRTVAGYPDALTLNYDHSPETNIHWKVFRENGQEVGDLSIDATGTLHVEKMAASGRYHIIGYDDTEAYTTEPLLLKVYQYLEYEIGLETYKSEVNYDANDPDNGTITYTYGMHSRWEYYSWNWLSKARLNGVVLAKYFAQREMLNFPMGHLPLHPITSSETTNQPHIFVTQHVETMPYNPQFTVWDDLTAASFLLNRTTDQNHAGIRGQVFEFAENEYYFLRQKDVYFYNGTYE